MSVFHDILKRYWGYEDFRPLQLDIIQSVAAGKDTLGLMPTGGGKSLTFQVPALALEGICIVVTPLVALMKDQVQRLRDMGIRAACVHSGMSNDAITRVYDNCLYGDFKFLYISPERLATRAFQERLMSLKVNILVVDEAHCISQWGYDFRPSYLHIAAIRPLLPNVPVLAVTATATTEVVTDIQERLLFPQENVFRVGFERPNLAYVVRKTEDKLQQILGWLQNVPGTAVVYVRMRKRTREIAQFLQEQGISVDYYHAGLSEELKNKKQADWKENRTRVIVSTNAFGMGIDKADVRLVLHYDLPDSPEAYFQEAGRAGRDGKKAYAVLLFHPSDATTLKRRVSDTFPQKPYIRTIYDKLCYYYELAPGEGDGARFVLDMADFASRYHLNINQVHSALTILNQAGYLEYNDDPDDYAHLMMTIDRDDLYDISFDEKEEDFLQVLLRSYSGLFADYIPIQEEVLAERCGLDKKEIYRLFNRLSSLGVLHYIPRRQQPCIIFTHPRVEG
ncbi:MAG: ATP-dependent DNA helicase RecQ, partial [Bacteroidales bacterium]|nr:ATP-dependent DNA helicase RecQ [Bacteroidales bacterium]